MEHIVDIAADELPIEFSMENSPVIQARLWAPVMQAYPWQNAVFDACWRPGAQVACRTCNESGKSSFEVPVLSLSFAAAFPGSQTVITSASEDQIKEQLWPAIRAMAVTRKGWIVTSNKITAPSIDGIIPGSTIIIRVTKQGSRFEGYHVRKYTAADGREVFGPLMIISDEGKSVHPEIYEAIERCNPTVELRISTTGEDSGDFYDSCMNTDGLWTTGWDWNGEHHDFVIPWTKCPHLLFGKTYERKKALLAKLGQDHPTVCSILLAEFFRAGTRMVFQDTDMTAVKHCMAGLTPRIKGHKQAFCDFSGGGDELTFQYREGNYIHPIVAWHRSGSIAPSVEADKYIMLFKQAGFSVGEASTQIAGDNGGLGAGIISEMSKKSWNIKRINPNVKAKDEMQFVDRYAEWHWDLKELIQDQMLIIPNDKILLEQMRLRRYLMKNTEDNKVRIEPKDDARKNRREKSPDRLDTLVHLCRNMEDMPKMSELANPCPKTGTVKEFWDKQAKFKESENESFFGGEWAD